MQQKPELIGRVVLLAVLLFVAVGYGLMPELFHSAIKILRSGNVSFAIETLQQHGSYTKAALFAMIVLFNTVAVLPNLVLVVVAGALFGIVEGTLIVWTAETLGTTISFFLLRYLFRSSTREYIQRHRWLNRVDHFSGSNGFQLILFARAVPYLPSGLITAVAALSRVSAGEHVFATLLGKLPSAIIEVTIGHDIFAYQYHLFGLVSSVVVSLVLYWLFKQKERS